MTMRPLPQPQPSNAEIMAELRALRALFEQRVPLPQPMRRWLTIREVAEATRLTQQAVTGICRRAHVGIKVGRSWQVDAAHFCAYWRDRFGRTPPGFERFAFLSHDERRGG
jgi:hypothetical protein